MEIGILTQTLHNNYGGLLQNYALQQVLIRAGHIPCTIDHSRTHKRSRLHELFRKVRAHVRHLLFPRRYKRPVYVASEYEEMIIAQQTRRFVDKYICRTKTIETHREFLEIANTNKFHAYVVGSDQCWRPQYNRSFLKEMFLSFVEKQDNIKRIAYAASFGKDEWNLPAETMSEYARLAKKFDLITVREESGMTLCKNHLGVVAQHVLDPTMLLSREDYIRLVNEENEPKSPGTLFYYIIDPSEEKTQFVNNVTSQMRLVPFTVMAKHPRGYRTKDDIKNHIEECVYPSVTSWLRAYMDAEMTIVDSFHGMVFSIIFNLPFWVIGNKNRGMSRFTSLLKMFGLENRMISISQLETVNLQAPIDWNRVNLLKEKLANNSVSLLYEALKED